MSNLNINRLPKIIAVSKTFKIDKILPLIEHGHINFGENKVQEAIDKWTEIKSKNSNIKLHMIGKLQTNKVKFAVKLFDYIHSVDSEKLAKKISDEQLKINKNIKIFIQVNIGNENQKSGISKDNVLVTRNLSNDILAGVTRNSILRYAKETEIKIEERPFTIDEAINASEAFVSSATTFIGPVVEIDNNMIGDGKPGPQSLRLRQIYIEESLKKAL